MGAKKVNVVNGAVLVVGVACGKPEVLSGSDCADKALEDTPGPPAGFNSRIVNDPHSSQSYKDLAAKHGEPLLTCDNEIVVFNDDAIVPKYLIIFSTTGS